MFNATADCFPDDSPISISFGTILFVGIGLSYVSQHVSLIRSRRTAGLSWVMLCVANISNFCSLLNAVLLSWVVPCCELPSTSSANCYELWLPLLQIGMPSLHLVPIYIEYLVLWHPEEKKTESGEQEGTTSESSWRARLRRVSRWMDRHEKSLSRLGFVAFVVLFLFLLTAVGAVLTFVPGSGSTERFAEVLGGFASVSNMVQWLPQIISTLRAGKVGSLSVLMLALQVPGGVAVVIFNTVVTPSSITTWGPFLLSAAQQFLLLCICIVFTVRDWRKERSHGKISPSTTTDSGESDRLIVN